jgi:chromosome segregation ATPase
LDEENDEPVPSLAGLAEAGHVDDLPEDLSAESLAADWGKNDELHDEIARLTKERDDALAEGDSLLRQLREIQESEKDKDTSAPSAEELATVTKERDQTRSEYIKLREEFENLKREKAPSKGKLSDSLPEVGKEVKKLREELAEKDRELHAVKTTTTGMDDAVETLKAEVNELKEQIKKAKDDAAVAQRGLALSQKALQETREALREASESAHPKPGLGSLGK